MKKCVLIVNPCSGRQKIQTEMLDIIKILNENDYIVETQVTLRHNHAREIAANVKNADIIVCTGGDGTLSQVIAGVVDSNSNIPVGYIPMGSTNDYANTLGLSFKSKEAITNIVNGKKQAVDVGQFGDFNFFNYVASFGLFTSASYNTPQASKNIFGNAAYVVSGLADLAKAHPYHVKMKANGEIYEDDYILCMVLNTTSVGGVLKIKEADVDLSDGLFEVLMIKNPKNIEDWNSIFDGIINCNFSHSAFTFIKTSELEMFFDENISWSLDGEEQKTEKYIKITNLNKRINLIK